MSGREPELPGLGLEFAGIAAASATVQERAAEILRRLGRIKAFDAGWLAARDPEQNREVPLATTGAAPLREGLAAALFTTYGRHIGFLSLLSADPSRPSRADCRVVVAV